MAEKNKIINKTIDASGLDVPIEGIFMKEKRYALTPLEHKILSESETKLQEWSKRFLLISIGLLLTTFSKVVLFLYSFQSLNDDMKKTLKLDIKSWELLYLAIGLLISFVLFLLSKTRLDNSEKKRIMKTIKNYFDAE